MKQINLTRGKVALVDDDDYETLIKFKWCASRCGFGIKEKFRAERRGPNSRLLLMHRQIMDITDPKVLVDHINGDPLDNRRENLRAATHAENSRNMGLSKKNTTGYKGVRWNKNLKKWRASIWVGGRHMHLGLYTDARSAALAYNDAATLHFGEYARLNSILNMKAPITEDVIMFNPDKYQCWLTGYGAGRFGAKTETRPTDQVKDFLTRNEEGKSKREKHKR